MSKPTPEQKADCLALLANAEAHLKDAALELEARRDKFDNARGDGGKAHREMIDHERAVIHAAICYAREFAYAKRWGAIK